MWNTLNSWQLVVWCPTALFEHKPLSVSFSFVLHSVELSVKDCFCDTVPVCNTVKSDSYYDI